jgi:transcriptional regulator with XRE-family HTH domain
MSTLGERLKLLRKNKDLTQKELADQLAINRDALAKWETDRAFPDISILVEIAKFFNITADELLGRESDSFPVQIMTMLRQAEGLLSKEEKQFLMEMISHYIDTVRSKKKN